MNALRNFDSSLFWLINSHHSSWGDALYFFITNLGNGWIIAPALVLLIVIKIPRRRLRSALLLSAMGMLSAGLTNSAAKSAVNRPRPLVYFAQAGNGAPGRAASDIHIVGKAWKTRSFPSGHTETAFSAATVLGLLFGGWYWLAYLAAALVGYSRVYAGVHFPLDVAAGAIIGTAVTAAWVLWYRARPGRDSRSSDTDKTPAPAGPPDTPPPARP
jgi:undecaprenyl-diphosphatase